MRTSRPDQRPGISEPKAGSFLQRDPLRRRYIGNVGLNGVVHEADIFKKNSRDDNGLVPVRYNNSPHRCPRRAESCPTSDVRTRLGAISLFGPCELEPQQLGANMVRSATLGWIDWRRTARQIAPLHESHSLSAILRVGEQAADRSEKQIIDWLGGARLVSGWTDARLCDFGQRR